MARPEVAARPRGAPAANGSPRRPDPLERVYTWPHFLIIEFVGLMVFTLLLFLLSVILKAPLLDLARPEYTPNPSKAPWYLLNLQELLLHMHPALAGVIVPGVALLLVAAIPYVDKDEAGTGVWFTSRKGVEIFRFSFVYTVLWVWGLILFDEFYGTKKLIRTLGVTSPQAVEFLGGVLVPVLVMWLIPVLLAYIIRRRWDGDTRHIVIGLFTIFVASYFALTVVGTAFRGESMRITWPWLLRPPH